MKALGLKYSPGRPSTTGPVKAGFHEGRTGLRVSPSFDGLYESCGVKGRPDCTVSIPLSCHPSISLSTHRRPCMALPCPKGRSYVALMTALWRISNEVRP